MTDLTFKEQRIIGAFLEQGELRSSALHERLIEKGEKISLVTIKRALSQMTASRLLIAMGSGRSRTYKITSLGRLYANVDAKQYCTVDPDKRYGLSGYNFDLLRSIPADIFTTTELTTLQTATATYHKRILDLPQTIQKKEMERLIIELSWKSSKIEGNTYTLLDTEKLILENKEAVGHDREEAQMILNHKDAFNFIHEKKDRFSSLTRVNLEELHKVLVKDLSVGYGLRKKPVGVTGSLYRPLDNIHQIQEAIESLGEAVSRMSTPYAKALVALLGISYIQPFEDGNKRTARLMANALLMAHGAAPLSYRSVDENDYRETMLTFYELNSIVSFRKIFVGQYEFAARNYAVK